MTNEQIKEKLLSLEDTDIDFSVTMSGKESKKVNGLYKPLTHEIILHNLNFKSENQLMYTAIHEYTHHLITVKKTSLVDCGLEKNSCRVHTAEFWVKFHELIDIAEEKGFYSIGVDGNEELENLTKEIKTKYLAENGKLMVEFGKLLGKAYELCKKANVRYEDYIDRVLQLPRETAKTIQKISVTPLDTTIGFENMKLVANAPLAKRQEVLGQIKAGKSPDTVRSFMRKKATDEDKKTMLEKERNRLKKTIEQLTARLQIIEESLDNE